MLVNRDENNAHEVAVTFDDTKTRQTRHFSGPVTVVSFGSEQYVWINDGPNSHADPDGPPVTWRVQTTETTKYRLPKASVTVLRGKVPGLRD
jgi:hypothetical protein